MRLVAATGAALAALAAAAPGASAVTSAGERATRYLERVQRPDGGFGAQPGARSSALVTAWGAMALTTTRSPRARSVRRARAAVLRDARTVTDLGDVERTVLALDAVDATVPVRLRERLVRGQRADGSFEGLVNRTAFGVLALRATDRPASDRRVRRAAAWLASARARDGGFGLRRGDASSSPDLTGAALQALAASGRATSTTARGAARRLRAQQGLNGGYENAQSTAFAVQGLVAAGVDVERVRRDGSRSPVDYLRSLQAPDGSVRYSRTGRQTPVWVTAQALLALERRAFPLGDRREGR